jgi:hypothetical protein
VLVVIVSAAYFHGGAAWNQNARLDAMFTFVEPGPHRWTFRLDPFLPDPQGGINTGDWTRVGTRYYANKAPGTIMLGALVYLPLYGIESAAGIDLDHPPVASFNAFAINLLISVVPLAIALAGWTRVLERRAGPERALVLALLTWLGTALFPYATQIWGHTTAAAFVMMAIARLDTRGALTARQAVTAGGLLGMAVLCDYLALPVVAALTAMVALRQRTRLGSLLIGGAGPALLLLGYQWYCFGNPFHLPTEGTNPAFVDPDRALGLFGSISGVALFQLTVGPYRGVFLQMPLLLAALWGFARWHRRDRRDPLLWACVAGFAGNVLWVASFNGWHGGATACARYLLVALPLVVLAWRELPASRAAAILLTTSGAISMINMLAVAAVSPLVDERVLNPLYGETLRRFVEGDLHPLVLPIRLQHLLPDLVRWRLTTAWNWGDLMGLSGLSRIVPWIVLVGTFGTCAWLSVRRRSGASDRVTAEPLR